MKRIALMLGLMFVAYSAKASVTAFPGAEGEGASAVGGRGGVVIEVINLNDSGTGSFRACATASGPRTCVFRIGGTITLRSDIHITNPYLTVAGQTAPGGGIAIKGPVHERMIFIQTHDVIIRYLRLRPGPTDTPSCCGGSIEASNGSRNVIVDHCSISWAVDQNANVWYDSTNITYQWNVISEPLSCSNHQGGGCHGYNMIVGNGWLDDNDNCMPPGCTFNNISIHHNLFSQGTERNPRIETGPINVVNNVIYTNNSGAYEGWGSYFDDQEGLSRAGLPIQVNYISNYIKSGSSAGNQTAENYVNSCCAVARAQIYLTGNANASGTAIANAVGSGNVTPFLVDSPILMAPITTTSAADAYTAVTSDAGASKKLDCNGNLLANYDSADTRVINDVRNGTGSIINSPSDVGGWPALAAGSPCIESLHDGIPDQWKKSSGLSTTDAGLYSRMARNGYTYLENYLNATAALSDAPNPPTDLTVH